jgi:hypothetical protein
MMHKWPFSAAEWGAVVEATRLVVNATLADDDVLQASHFVALQIVLTDLRGRYSDHPALLETEADFLEDVEARVALYEKAKKISLAHGLQTLSIRLSLAEVLAEDVELPQQALEELHACRHELEDIGDDWDRKRWSELFGKCERSSGE